MSAGRPTDYLPEYTEQMLDYFNVDAGKDVAYETSAGETKTARVAADFPTLAGFACKIGVHRDTLNAWCAKFPEFSDAYKMAKEHQERILVQNGLKEGYHANFAIFTAKNVLNWRDKQDVEHTGKDGKDLVPDLTDKKVIDDVARRLAFILSAATDESSKAE